MPQHNQNKPNKVQGPSMLKSFHDPFKWFLEFYLTYKIIYLSNKVGRICNSLSRTDLAYKLGLGAFKAFHPQWWSRLYIFSWGSSKHVYNISLGTVEFCTRQGHFTQDTDSLLSCLCCWAAMYLFIAVNTLVRDFAFTLSLSLNLI